MPYTPVFFAYLLVENGTATCFSDKDLQGVLHADVQVAPYGTLLARLEGLAVWMDSGTTVALRDAAKRAIVEDTPVRFMKIQKNAEEVAGMRASHLRDGAAKTQFLFWAQDAVRRGGETEVSLADQLERFRKEHGRGAYRGASFPTISAFGANAAIVHYEPQAKSAHDANPEKLYLVDSGGQYEDGTTDVTRTVSFKEHPGEFEREAYTRVLKGVIALSTAVFPENVGGPYLDALARQYLWQAGLNYEHSTGHGVGHFLSVHEGPIAISSNPDQVPALHAGLEPGMILSNEPGYYEDGSFGIRIENLMLVVLAETPHQTEGKRFLTFETLTLVPLDKSLVDTALLTSAEVKWVDGYHARVLRELAPLLPATLQSRLADACAPLSAAYAASLLLVVAALFVA